MIRPSGVVGTSPPSRERTFVGVAVLLGVTALAANLVPALHATRVDPAVVLSEG